MTPACVYRDDACELWHADALLLEHVAAVMGERAYAACLKRHIESCADLEGDE